MASRRTQPASRPRRGPASVTGTPGGSRPHSSCPKRCQGRIRRQGEHSCRPPPTAGFHQGDQRLEIGWRRAWGSDGGRGTSQPALPPITQQSATGGKSSFQSGGCSGDCRLIWSVGRGLLAGDHQTSQPEWRTPTSVDPPGIAGPEKTLLLGQVPVGAPPGRGGARDAARRPSHAAIQCTEAAVRGDGSLRNIRMVKLFGN